MSINSTRNRIRMAAQALFFQNGIKSVSMDDLAHHLGVSKKTIYSEFENKDELVISVIRELLDENHKSIDCRCTETPNAIEESICAMENMQVTFAKFHSSLLFDIQKFYPDVHQLINNYKEKILRGKIVTNLKRGIEEGLYRPEIDLEVCSRLRIEALLMVFNAEIWQMIPHDFVRINKEITVNFLYGIATPKGYKMISNYLTKTS